MRGVFSLKEKSFFTSTLYIGAYKFTLCCLIPLTDQNLLEFFVIVFLIVEKRIMILMSRAFCVYDNYFVKDFLCGRKTFWANVAIILNTEFFVSLKLLQN